MQIHARTTAIVLFTGILSAAISGCATPSRSEGSPGASVAAPASAPSAPQASPAPSPAAYLPTSTDFIGKWQLYGAAVRPPADLGQTATDGQHAAATSHQRPLLTFYRAFAYLEITEDGRFRFVQRGESNGQDCAWCGKWSFHDGSLWLDLAASPRLDIYAAGGPMQMTYTAEPGPASMMKWQAVGWRKMR